MMGLGGAGLVFPLTSSCKEVETALAGPVQNL